MAPTCALVCLLTLSTFVILTSQSPLLTLRSHYTQENNNSTTTRRPCSIFAKNSCFCTLQFVPLCGSDGITYSNLCQFNCAQKCKPNLTIAKCGHCWQKGNHKQTGNPKAPCVVNQH